MNHQIARMAFSQAFQLLRITGIAFVILPYFSLGLLSDYKICGDSECESLMSRVQAIRDHHGKDCRFLNFRQGDTIFVYHKLMGKREDLWAGTIDKQFGYFPKDAVQEEQVYATMEKVVQTQKSDFICMNEFGYPIDSSHLDSDDDDNNQKIPNEESKTTQTDQCTDDTSAESPSASVNLFTESPVSAQQSDGTSIEEGENKNAADAPGRIHKEVQETPAGLIEQGGSPSSSWLGSSVTGWLGLEQEEQPANLAEGGGKGEIKERQAETSSMMGWLGFGGGEGNPNDAVKNREKHKEAANSLTSTMTRWLGFGGEKRTVFTKKEQDEEREIDEESDLKETFRSRRMSLDLEGSQLHEEEKEKTGTLDWLGNGLSSVLGFGMTNQGLGHKTISGQEAEETIEEKKEQPVSNSWLDIGIRDILGFRNDKTEVDESKVSGSNDKEKDTTLEAATGTENVDTSQSQPAQTTEPDIQSLEEQLGLDTIPEGEDNYISNFIKDSNKLNVEDKDQVLQYNTEPESASLSLVKEDTNNNNIDASHWSKDSSLPTDAASKVDQEDISPQAKLEEESQGVGGTYEERLAETEIEGYQMPQIIGKDDEDNTAPVEEKIKSTSDTVHDFLTRTHNSMGRFVSKAEEDDKDQPQSKKTGSVNEEGARITNHIDDTEDSTVLIGASNEEYARERSTVDTDALHRDISTAQLDESAEHSQVSDNAEESSGKSKPPFSSGSANERNEPTHSVKPDVHNSDILAMTDNNKETETHHAELVENGRAHTLESRSQEFRSSHSTNRSAPSPYEMFSEVVTLTQDTNMDNTDQDSASLQLEQRIIQDAVDQLGETKKKGKKIPQQAHSNKEKLEFEKEILNDVSQKSAIRSEIETETEEVEELQEEVKRDELKEVEESKEGDKQQKLDEEKQEKVDEIMEEKKQEEVDTLKAEERQQEAEDVKEKQQEVEELKEEEEQEQVEKVSKDETGEEVEEVKEQEKQEQLDKAKKEDKKEEVGELKDDKYDEVEEFKEEENVEEIEEEKKQEKADELQEEERQAKVEEFKDEKKLEEMEDLKEVEMQQKIAELKEEERQAEVEVLKEEKMQEEVQKLKEVEKQEEFKEVHGLKEKETEEGKEKHLQSLHLEVQKKNTHDIGKAEPVRNEKETQDEKPKMERMQTGKEKKEEEKTNQEMVEEVKAETKQVEEMQQVNDVEGEWWDKEEEESLKCSHELCPQAESESVRDRDEKISEDGPCSGAEATIQTGKQNYEILENGTRESQTTPTDGMEGDRGREEETKTISNVANADEVEKRNCKSNPTWNEDISNNANDISDPIGLDIDQIGATKCTVNDPQLADEDGHSGSSTRDSAESQAEKTLTHVSQDPATSTDPSGLVQNESPGAFGLFKNAFSFFSKRPFSETKETTESAPCLETSTEVMKQILDFVRQITEDSAIHVHAVRELLMCITVQVVSALPDDFRPGPDLYGLPWEPVIISSLVGLVTVLLFTCRCYSSVKSRMYRNKEQWMAEQVAQLLDDKCQVLETLSRCQQEYDELEDSLRDSGVLAQTQKTEHLEVKAKQLEHDKTELERDLEELKDQLDRQRKHRTEQERRITVLEESMKTFEEETKALQSQEEQAQTTLKVYKMNSDRLQRNLETAGEESTLLQESNAQLRQQVEGWAERVSELEADMRRCEVAHSGMQQDVANKDERIMSLTDRLLRMKAWDSDLEEEEGGEGGEKEVSSGTAGKGDKNGRTDIMDTQGQLQKVQKLIYAAKLNADLKSVDEEKDRVFAKLNDEVKAKEDLQMSIKELENEKLSLQSDAEHYTDQVQRLQQKLQIMTEMYQENELKLHRLLTVEEKERLQKEEKLHKADKNIALAMEELNNYRQRAEEVQEELDKTKHSYQTQISAHEKKAHNNWLAARAAERELADIRRENALLRQKLTDTQFKLDALDKDPYALKSLARPLPFRAERSPYGPSPLGRPTSETRPFLSPPTLMDGPPARLSPRMFCGPAEPPGGQGDLERSGGPHSDSGSNSPIWERDRRGPPPEPPGPPGPIGPPGYLFSEPGGPMYRRPPPPPGALGLLPPPGCLPPGPRLPHPRGVTSAAPPGAPLPKDMADGAHRENSFGPGELEHSESGPGDRRSPPEAHSWMGGPPPPGDRRSPPEAHSWMGGPPPPDFYPPKGPGGPPMMPMWAPPPRGIMFPSRFPPLGPPLQPAPGPHYVPPMRPPPPDGFPLTSMGPSPSQQSLPSPPHSQSPEEYTPSPEDAI